MTPRDIARLGYVTLGDSSDVKSWSGLNSHILSSLRGVGFDVAVADRLPPSPAVWPRVKARYYRHVRAQQYPLDRDTRVARYWAKQAALRLRRSGDVRTVVAPGAIPVAFLPDEYRVAIWADATFHSLRSTYPEFTGLCRSSIDSGDQIEQRALDRAEIVCFASEWAAGDAVAYYGVRPDKIKVIPFGANCPPVFAHESAAREAIAKRSRTECRLVFLGVDWHRKGGPLVIEIVERLRKAGVPAQLSVIGCPRPARALPSHVDWVGFLDKQDPAQHEVWDRLMRAAHFLVVPSLAECYGLAYAEASAYGVPSLARNVGGVSSVVRHGTNGFLFASDDEADRYVELIARLWSNPAEYHACALAAFGEWKTRLNWNVAGAEIARSLKAILS